MTDVNIHNIITDLKCPITMDWLEDPIRMPCCTRAVSRQSMLEWRFHNSTCPVCSTNISSFDADRVPKDILLAGLVASLQAETELHPIPKGSHQWSARFTPIKKDYPFGKLTMDLENSNFNVRKSLFIALVDKSGSMCGSPINQVKSALKHIYGLSQTQTNTKVILILYDSCAKIVDFTESVIEKIQGGGGTHFRGAFASLKTILSGYISSNKPEDREKANNIGSVAVAFLTDGKDGGNMATLVQDFKETIQDVWISKDRDITVHTIGFSSSCDKDLLEGMRTTGSHEGVFRYAEPGDGDDTLCQKITGVYDICSKGSTNTISLHLSSGRVIESVISVNERGTGTISVWLTKQDLIGSNLSVTITSELDNQQVDVVDENSQILIDRTLKDWVSKLIDNLAVKFIELNKQREIFTPSVMMFQCTLLTQQIDDLRQWADDNEKNRLDFMESQVHILETGQKLSIDRLNDMKFTSLFKHEISLRDHIPTPTRPAHPIKPAIDIKSAFETNLKHYTRNRNIPKGRNDLQIQIMDNVHGDINVSDLNNEILQHSDNDGNTALMLASFCGHVHMVCTILKSPYAKGININDINNDDESALTLAIKARGYDKTICLLLEHGANIPQGRKKPLEMFAIANKYKRTATIISALDDNCIISMDVDSSMTVDYIKYTYMRAILSPEFNEKYRSMYFNVALSKGTVALKDMVIDLLERGVTPTIKHINEYCMPKKPDAEDIPEYLDLVKLLVAKNANLIYDVDDDGESALYVSAKKGSLPHVKYFIEQGSKIDQPNNRLATPLWCACYRRFPCIINELLDHGADIGWKNESGNIPLYGPCERGSRKVAELLISRGSPIENYNKNGDTLILIACRNGQVDVLRCLLEYVTVEYMHAVAHVDDFNAVMASAEAGFGECITVLKEYGFDLETKTPVVNTKVIGGATALHVAAYYGRVSAVQSLIACGANPNSVAMFGETPLHVAVVQGYVDVIKILRNVTDLSIRDNVGNTAASYCRDREDIRDLLVDKSLNIYIKLARGGFNEADTKSIISMLSDHKGVFGSKQFVNMKNFDGTTPLSESVLHGNKQLVEVLLRLGADVNCKTSGNMYPLTWATHNRNLHLVKMLKDYGADDTLIVDQINFLKQATMQRENVSILFLGKIPDAYVNFTKSGIVNRMSHISEIQPLPDVTVATDRIKNVLSIECNKTAIQTCLENGEFNQIHETRLVWYAKAFTVEKVANCDMLSASEVLAMCMFTNNSLVSRIINKSLYMIGSGLGYDIDLVINYIRTMNRALHKITPYTDTHGKNVEVFIGMDQVNRNNYQVGQEFTWGTYVSGSTLWRVAMEATPNYTSKSRRGVIFAIKSRTGRPIGHYSQFPFDSEVLFLPSSRFRVYHWFHGDPIALGQPNIREHSFEVRDESASWMTTQQMLHSDKSLIIAVEEI